MSSSFFAELRRRNVFRVGIVYGIAGWVIMQVADVMLPALKLPDWSITLVAALLVLGFPVVLIFAWAFELTPEGIKRTHEVPVTQSITRTTGRKLNFVIIGVLALAVAVLLVDRFLIEPRSADTTMAADASGRGGGEGGKFLAVLPFSNLSGSPEAEPFAAGIHDDLLTSLSKIAALKVMSRTSVQQYRDTKKPIREIAEELGVDNILEGGVQRAGTQVRINVQLIDASTDQHLWAETYNRELTAANIFAVQSEISSEITDALAVALSPEEKRRLAAVPTKNLDAYDQYLLGQQRLTVTTVQSFSDASRYFQRAMVLDPGFAPAYVGLARAYVEQTYIGSLTRDQLAARAEPLVRRALELDADSGQAHAVLGRLLAYQERDQEADAAFKRALGLAPNDASVHRQYGLMLSVTDRREEALQQYQAALELDPRSVDINAETAVVLEALGRRDDALAGWARIRELEPGNPWGYYGANNVYWGMGRLREAIPLMHAAGELDPQDPELPATLMFQFLDLEDADEARHWLEQTRAVQAEHVTTHSAGIHFSLYTDNVASARVEAGLLLATRPDNRYNARTIALSVMRDAEIAAGETAKTKARYLEYYPQFDQAGLIVSPSNLIAVNDYAYTLLASGETESAQRLLQRVLDFVDRKIERYGRGWDTWICDVQALALLGRPDEALKRLGEAADAHFYPLWWYWEKDPMLESIRDRPEFANIVARVRRDVAAQRAELARPSGTAG